MTRKQRRMSFVLVGAALIPYGGGSSVVGGVTPDVGGGFSGTIAVDDVNLTNGLEFAATGNEVLLAIANGSAPFGAVFMNAIKMGL